MTFTNIAIQSLQADAESTRRSRMWTYDQLKLAGSDDIRLRCPYENRLCICATHDFQCMAIRCPVKEKAREENP